MTILVKIKDQISAHISLYILVLSLFMILISATWQFYREYRYTHSTLESQIQSIYEHILPQLRLSLLGHDQKQLQQVLMQMAQLGSMSYLAVTVQQQTLAEYGNIPDKKLITHKIPIYHQHDLLGTLQIAALQSHIHPLIFLFNGILLGCVILLILLQRRLTHQLEKIAHYSEQEAEFEPQVDHSPQLRHLVSALKQKHQHLQQQLEANNTLETLLQTALTGLGLWDLNGQLYRVNTAFAQMLGRSITEMLTLNYWQDIVAETDNTHEQQQLQALTVGEYYGPRETVYRHRDGYLIPVKVYALLIEQRGQIYVWAQIDNISSQKRADMALQHAKKQAEEANLAKSQFLASMSHELRTPMNTIVGYSEMLEDEIKACEKAHLVQDVKNIHIAAKHLLGIIDGILDISKIEAGKMELYLEEFEVQAMLQHVVTTIQPLIENKANALHKQYDPQLGMMYSDQIKIRQILLNLLSNAAKFSEQGIITLTVNRSYQANQDWLVFTVKDEGIGMTPEQQTHLFQIFTQTDESIGRKYGGTGLGLAISRHFTHMLGGSIDVQSEFGQGSEFIVRLPAQLPKPEPAAQSLSEKISQLPTLLPAENGTLLVIDDDDIVRNLFETYLTKVGYRVAVAASGEEGLKLAKKLRPDAITLDVMMPGMDGWQVLAQLKAEPELAHIPVIMLTMVEDKDIGYSLGAAEYLTKPISRHQLINVLRKYRTDKAVSTVMLIEDDVSTREMMVRMLRKASWQVIPAENGKVALQQLKQQQADLIILDLMMPEMDGFEFITYLRQNEEFSLIPIVVMTAKDITAEEHAWLNQRVATVFQKGAYSREELLDGLRELLVNTAKKMSS